MLPAARARSLQPQLPRHPLRVPRRAHLGVEAVGFAQLAFGFSPVAREASAQLALAEARLAADGDVARPEIEAALQRASELTRQTGARLFTPQVHEQRAALAVLAGDGAEAERELREAHRLYSEMGATGHAERVARELAELGARP